MPADAAAVDAGPRGLNGLLPGTLGGGGPAAGNCGACGMAGKDVGGGGGVIPGSTGAADAPPLMNEGNADGGGRPAKAKYCN